MRALVVYESMFGNTRDVAIEVAAGLGEHLDVELVEVGGAPTAPQDVDLLVVGAPTHAFGLSRPTTRASAGEQAPELVSAGIGLREWLDTVEPPAGTLLATFDTRVARPRVPGSAAARARSRARGLVRRVLGRPETFWVQGLTGPLLDGELERARQWGRELADHARSLTLDEPSDAA